MIPAEYPLVESFQNSGRTNAPQRFASEIGARCSRRNHFIGRWNDVIERRNPRRGTGVLGCQSVVGDPQTAISSGFTLTLRPSELK